MLRINPCYPIVLALGKLRTGKDLLLVSEIYNQYIRHKSVFDSFLYMEGLQKYNRYPKNVYSNCWLDETVFPSHHYVDSIEDLESARDGIMYIHDADDWFDSRGWKLTDKRVKQFFNGHGKRHLFGLYSSHRVESIDIKFRVLFNLVVRPKMYAMGNDDYLDNYVLKFSVSDGSENHLGEFFVSNLNECAVLYDTEEEVKELKK